MSHHYCQWAALYSKYFHPKLSNSIFLNYTVSIAVPSALTRGNWFLLDRAGTSFIKRECKITFSREHDIVEVIWNPGSQFQFYYCWQRSYCREGKVLEIRILVYTVLVLIGFYIISLVLCWPLKWLNLHCFSLFKLLWHMHYHSMNKSEHASSFLWLVGLRAKPSLIGQYLRREP